MKKKLVLVLVLCFCCISLTGCDEYDFWGTVFYVQGEVDEWFFDGKYSEKAAAEVREREEKERQMNTELTTTETLIAENETTEYSSEVTTEFITESNTESSLLPYEVTTEATTEVVDSKKSYDVSDCDWIFISDNQIPIKITVPDGYFVFSDNYSYEISSDTSYLTFTDSGITSDSVMNDILTDFSAQSDSENKVSCATKKVKGHTIYYSQYVDDSGLEFLAFEDIGEDTYLQINLTNFEGVIPQELMNSLAIDLN